MREGYDSQVPRISMPISQLIWPSGIHHLKTIIKLCVNYLIHVPPNGMVDEGQFHFSGHQREYNCISWKSFTEQLSQSSDGYSLKFRKPRASAPRYCT